jgi:hypothetical protein
MIELNNLGYDQDQPRTPTWTNDNIGESFSTAVQSLMHLRIEETGEEGEDNLVCKMPV